MYYSVSFDTNTFRKNEIMSMENENELLNKLNNDKDN